MYNVLLQSDSETIKSLCQTNKIANAICHDKQFWIDKFTQEHLESLLIEHEPSDSYLELYRFGEEKIKQGKHILHINHLKK